MRPHHRGFRMRFLTIDPRDALRPEAERLIGSVYGRAYGARIAAFPRRLIALCDVHGALVCAAGLRLGWAESFSACYLDRDIGDLIFDATGCTVAPSRILEVTTLAGTGQGHALRLIERVREVGRGMDMACGIFTATAPLRRALRRAGHDVVALVPARRERVADPAVWGSYYDRDPWVCVLADRAPAPPHALLRVHAPAPGLLHA